MNKVIFLGNLSGDCELRYTQKNTAVANFNLAVNSGYGDNKRTDFVKCVMFGKRAESLSGYLLKGSKVLIEGSLHIDKSQDNKYYTSIVVNELTMLGSKSNGGSNNNSSNDTFGGMTFDGVPVDDGDMPF